MNLQLQNKIVIITGGAKGIGEGITRAFAQEGAVAIILGRNPDEAKTIIDDLANCGHRADSFHAEMTSDEDLRIAVADILNKYGCIDIIVNNAGSNDAVNLRATPEAFTTSLKNNLVHYFTLVHHALDALIKSQGNIVNIGSKTSITGQGGTSGYAAAKGAINSLTREWALDLAQFGIRVNCVIPAEVMTPLYNRWLDQIEDSATARKQLEQTIPLGGRTTTIEEIANTVVFTASKRASHTTGQMLYPDGGYVHLDRACTAKTSHLQTTP